ncbi:hypothetical protein LCI18_002705 [Fusarium solani-melongenae]|uniref:Uncharacterized protein n=1 Tax=Fusarium solani subsp. cucurbitae TaxID=2747967 RepID=A0ACD3YS48_FUSSC|nr:hypothetical protein LCI18_002705 [Fusarium solani-melongenae]
MFSTPTTWDAPISHCFRDIVSKAGFGENKLHKVALGLTEPEAAAVCTCRTRTVGKIHKGHVVLSIDAGGGTTDLAFVKATANTADSLTLEELHPVDGIGVGSAIIDREFAKLIHDRMKRHPDALSKLPQGFPLKASQSDGFQAWKHALGSKDWDRSQNDLLIEVSGLEKSYSNEDLGIKQGRLSFTRQQLESCFDIILKEIKGVIKRALDNFEGNNRLAGIARHVNHIVLSGGLGSSDYVLKELTTYINDLGKKANSCVAGSRVLRTKGNARMVVVEGLLYDRRTEARALREHIARANYGIIVEEPRSRGSAQCSTSPTIRWLVKFGETIQVGKPTTVEITKRLEKSDRGKWAEKIVWLEDESSDQLPTDVQNGWKEGMKELYSVDIETRQDTKSRIFWRRGKKASRNCDFKLTLVVGPSGDCVVEVSGSGIKRSG